MKHNNRVIKRLLAIYVIFFAVVVISIFGKIIPNFRSGYTASEQLASIYIENGDDDYQKFYLLQGVNIENYQNGMVLDNLSDDNVPARLNLYTSSADIVVEHDSDDSEPTGLSVFANNPIYYVAALMLSVAYIVLLILIALIIRSLRSSVIEQRSVERSNTTKVRVIGAIIIVAELVSAAMNWGVNLKAAELLRGTEFTVNTLYSPDYMVIIIGILVLFMGELFSITHSLGEEQKLTI